MTGKSKGFKYLSEIIIGIEIVFLKYNENQYMGEKGILWVNNRD